MTGEGEGPPPFHPVLLFGKEPTPGFCWGWGVCCSTPVSSEFHELEQYFGTLYFLTPCSLKDNNSYLIKYAVKTDVYMFGQFFLFWQY
jgi:hypothetical protein